MKKLLSLAIAALLTFSCALTAFAATDDSATPDEAKTPVKLKMIEPPSKTYSGEMLFFRRNQLTAFMQTANTTTLLPTK